MHRSQLVYGLQAVPVATSNSLFPFPMWCSWAGAYTILVSFEMTHRWNPYQRCGHRLFLSSFECCGWLPKHCTALSCTICPVICLNVVSLTKHSGWIVVFPIHDHSWKQQTSQHQPGQPWLASCWSVAVCSASALVPVSQCSSRLYCFPRHFEVFLTAETLFRQHVGTNYIIGVRQSAGHCVVLNLFNILRTLQPRKLLDICPE